MLRSRVCAALLGVGALAGAGVAVAQPGPMPPMPPASHDAAMAPAGVYALDPHHASVIAVVGHMNTISYSTFRFGGVSGTLDWRPASIEASKVDIDIQMGSIETPVAGFAEELKSDKFLDVAKYPVAHFVSTSITRTGPDAGVISGMLTFMGQTRPMTIKADLVGIGRTMSGATAVGFHGSTSINRSDFGYTALIPIVSDKIDIVMDAEFDKAG